MRYHKIEKHSIANGTGIRTVLWVSGCRVRCKGCQNPQTWDFDCGKMYITKMCRLNHIAVCSSGVGTFTLLCAHLHHPPPELLSSQLKLTSH